MKKVGNPLSADLASPYINGGSNPKKKRVEKVLPADLPYETWRYGQWFENLYADSREPPPPRNRRGRGN